MSIATDRRSAPDARPLRSARVPRPLRVVGPLALAIVGVIACGGEDDAEDVTARLVETAAASTDDAVERLTVLADVHGEVEVRVFSQLPERVRILHVEEGQRVLEGDPIVTLEADLPASEVGQASAALVSAEARRDQISADLERIRGLVERNVLPTSQRDTLQTQLRGAEAQVDQLRAARRAAGQRRDRTVVRAPASGVIAMLSVAEGDMVSPQMPLCAVVEMDRVDVKFRVVEADYVRLREGMEVTIAPPALPDVQRTGTITHISPVIDQVTRTGGVEVALPNEGHALRPGMVAEVIVELERRAGVTMVPARAVMMTTRTDTAREGHVYVVEGDRAERRVVGLGRRYGEQMEITSGLEPGERVVVLGQHMLRDGSPIRERSIDDDAVANAPPAGDDPEPTEGVDGEREATAAATAETLRAPSSTTSAAGAP